MIIFTPPPTLSGVDASVHRFPELRCTSAAGDATTSPSTTSLAGREPSILHEDMRLVGRSGSHRLVFVLPSEVWVLEARDRLVFVHGAFGRLDIDMSLSELEPHLGPTFLRVHRNWLVALNKVRELRWRDGRMCLFAGDSVGGRADARGVDIPVSRNQTSIVKQRLLAHTCGLSSRRARAAPCEDDRTCPVPNEL
jgi:hypothetical protein